jgi:hypothetical protein
MKHAPDRSAPRVTETALTRGARRKAAIGTIPQARAEASEEGDYSVHVHSLGPVR